MIAASSNVGPFLLQIPWWYWVTQSVPFQHWLVSKCGKGLLAGPKWNILLKHLKENMFGFIWDFPVIHRNTCTMLFLLNLVAPLDILSQLCSPIRSLMLMPFKISSAFWRTRSVNYKAALLVCVTFSKK